MQWACFQGFAPPEPLVEYVLATRKRFAKPLKIRPRPLNAIDVVLKRMAVTERLSLFFVPDLPGWLFQGVTAVGCLPPPLFPSVSLPPSLQLRRDRRGQGVPHP
jgi:hypothetical protein